MKTGFKKFLVSVLLFGFILSNLAPAAAFAQPVPSIESRLEGFCSSFWETFTVDCVLYVITWLAYDWLRIVGLLLTVSGYLFNAVLGVAIDNANYSMERITALKDGWEFSRDVVNLFFIFILLFIAIATILQIESYGAK